MATREQGFSSNELLARIDQAVRRDFDAAKRVLSFEEYLVLITEQPERQLRASARYVSDLMDHYGKIAIELPEGLGGAGATPPRRYQLFDRPVNGHTPGVVGHENVQNQIARTLSTFVRQGMNNKLLLLHGPNGSAKSSIAHSLMSGMEDYSHTSEGAVYTFSWIFPHEKFTKGGMGISTYPTNKDPGASFAHLSDEDISARISCDLKDHPWLIVPKEQRQDFLQKLLGAERAKAIWDSLPLYLTQGDLCHRCRLIADALLTSNGGDFRKLLQNIQVERFYFSRRYRKGLVTIEPQMHVDAQYHQLTMAKSMGSLPPSLQGLNLFTLTGDLIDGNRGLIEYSDLLKRPVDAFKYLLGACESGSVNIGTSIAYVDTVMIGSTNELQLDAFKEFPDFTSFKARIDLVRVPYLLSVSQEQKIYDAQLSQIAGDKHSSPHVTWAAALWAVLTRLKKPNSINYPPSVSTLISNLTPVEKSRLYDNGEMPGQLSAEDRKLLRSHLRRLREEYLNIPYYEGRMGASAREMKSILFDAAQNPEFPCLSPLALLRELEEFVKRLSEYEFLKQDVKDGYHDAGEFIHTVRAEYLNRIDREVRDSIGLYDSQQWEEFMRKYVQQVSLILKKEKQKNPITGKLEDPDFTLVQEFEKIVEAPPEGPDRDSFRQNMISQVGAWSLDHAGKPVVYSKVFPQYWRKLEKHYFESQKALLTKMSDALRVYGTAEQDTDSEGGRLARTTIENMKSKLGYCEHCAREVIGFLMRQRY